MTRAVAPKTLPTLPERATGWARSTRRAGTMFHAHRLGQPACSAQFYLDRFECKEATGLGDMQYFGVCPGCFKLGGNV